MFVLLLEEGLDLLHVTLHLQLDMPHVAFYPPTSRTPTVALLD
jgi:hypothetical protein